MNHKDVRFLLVEDDDDHAMLAQRAFKKRGIGKQVSRAVDGVEALEILRKDVAESPSRKPIVVLLDLNLPKMNGLEVLSEIRSDELLEGTPVVIVTTSAEEEDITRAYGLKVNSYLRKPFQPDQLQKMFEDMTAYWAEWNEPPRV